MSQLPRYESYKDSGVQWLGEIPSHWKVIAFHYVSRLKSGDSITALDFVPDGEYPVYGGNGYRGNIDRFNHDGRYVLIGRQGALCGNVNLADGKFFATEHAVVVYKNENIDTDWLYYLLDTMNLNQYSTTAAQPGISAEVIGRLKIPLPTIDEQKNIASLLNRRLAQVDALIAKQETLLEKLAEQRVVLISHAVTKGLNPDVKLQKSDSEILGLYPETWKVKRLRFEIETNPSKSEIKLEESELVSFIPMEAVSVGGGLDLSNERMISEVSSGYTYFADGDVIVAKITPCFENGKASIAENLHQGMAFGTTELHVLRCKKDLLNKFLFFIIQSDKFMKYGESEMYGAGGQKRVPERFIKDYLIALPSLVEQKQICDFIESQLSHLDGLVQKVESTIATFKEYRSTLITQVVTGKIDVRNLKVN